jgi:hypothetical protein
VDLRARRQAPRHRARALCSANVINKKLESI